MENSGASISFLCKIVQSIQYSGASISLLCMIVQSIQYPSVDKVTISYGLGF